MLRIKYYLIFLCIFSFGFNGCKKKSEEIEPKENYVVRGKVYGKAFNMAGGRANTDIYESVERVVVNLSGESGFNCGSPERDFDVYFRVPKQVGLYTAQSRDIWLGFNNRETGESVGFVSADAQVEITSVDQNRIKGRINFEYQRSNSQVDGTFDVPLCK